MCLACEQDAIWFAYLESQGLLKPDDPAAVDALFGAFPVQPLPMQEQGEQNGNESAKIPDKNPAKAPAKIANNNPFSCDDPNAE
jgi:hypothetical protein